MSPDPAQRVQALVEMIERARAARVTDTLSRARGEAAGIVRRARTEARTRVGRAAQEDRRRMVHEHEAAKSELATLFRRLADRAHRLALEESEGLLLQVLRERWQNPAQRKAWIAGLIADAIAILPPIAWRIEHPAELAASELMQTAASVEDYCRSRPELVVREGQRAGLRIVAGSAVLDGTIEGLLSRKVEVEARLLAEVDRREAQR